MPCDNPELSLQHEEPLTTLQSTCALVDVSSVQEPENTQDCTSAKEEDLPTYVALVLRNGCKVHLMDTTGGGRGLSRTTGWTTWDSAHVLISYLQDGLDQKSIVDDDETGPLLFSIRDAVVVDISTGNGLVAAACAAMGAAAVIATEVPACVALTRRNCSLLQQNTIVVQEYTWGERLLLSFEKNKAIAILCDALFIAIRDGLQDELARTVQQAVQACRVLLFLYEERVVDQEEAFMTRLLQGVEGRKVPQQDLDLDAAQKADAETSSCLTQDLFYEPPSVQLWILQQKNTR